MPRISRGGASGEVQGESSASRLVISERDGTSGADLSALSNTQRARLLADTPLWFYTLREAELNGGKLTGVGGRIVAETFHRTIEGSRFSILRAPNFKPTLGPDDTTFRMVDLLLFACNGQANQINPLGN